MIQTQNEYISLLLSAVDNNISFIDSFPSDAAYNLLDRLSKHDKSWWKDNIYSITGELRDYLLGQYISRESVSYFVSEIMRGLL